MIEARVDSHHRALEERLTTRGLIRVGSLGERGREGRREGGKEGRREGGKEGAGRESVNEWLHGHGPKDRRGGAGGGSQVRRFAKGS